MEGNKEQNIEQIMQCKHEIGSDYILSVEV